MGRLVRFTEEAFVQLQHGRTMKAFWDRRVAAENDKKG